MENNDRDENVSEMKLAGDNGSVKVLENSVSANGSGGCEGEDNRLSYANTLRSRNKYVEALAVYERVLESDSLNVEALIGKGICLQMQNMGKLAFDAFSEAVKLDPQNVCALTHCGVLYKEEGRLVEAAEVCLQRFNTSMLKFLHSNFLFIQFQLFAM